MTDKENSGLLIHETQIDSIFEILGTNENNLSYALGYVLSKSPRLLKSIIKKVFHKKIKFKTINVELQTFGKDKGFTDFEITIDNEFHFVIEAKKGWVLPSRIQLKRYLNRFRDFKKTKRMFIILSDCSEVYVNDNLPHSLYSVPITSITWREIIKSINQVYPNADNKEKYLLRELKEYLQKVVQMENKESNWVYVVSLANNTPSWSKISWKDVVYKKKRYFYPADGGWPKIPPNYIAFRFDGKLQSIHHVEDYEVVDDMHKEIKEIKKGKLTNHNLLKLGPKFVPKKNVQGGNLWSNGRRWCMLDTLFTSKTIEEACDISKRRG